MVDDWQSLTEELDCWDKNGLCATFWWRDDDATTPSPNLHRMLDIAEQHSAPLALAVIPSLAKPELAELLNTRMNVDVLQHGFAHTNHAPPDEKKSEFGQHRQTETVCHELSSGQHALKIFDRAHPILVPPWNRIAPPLLDALAHVGFKGISTYAARGAPYAASGLFTINTHVDIIDWHGTRGFVGTNAAVALAVEHLKAKRNGNADTTEPTGLLSHHLVHDEACWGFIETFLHHLKNHGAARMINVMEAWPT